MKSRDFFHVGSPRGALVGCCGTLTRWRRGLARSQAKGSQDHEATRAVIVDDLANRHPDGMSSDAYPVEEWVRQRRRGSPVRTIARFHGVAPSLVARLTKPHGPFPVPDDVQRMIEARRAGQSLAAIASEAGLSVQRVSQLTQAHGPFGRSSPDAALHR